MFLLEFDVCRRFFMAGNVLYCQGLCFSMNLTTLDLDLVLGVNAILNVVLC